MANNIHISYDLHNPGRDYDSIINAIKRLGSCAKIHYSFWYVRTNLTAAQVRDLLLPHMDRNDSLYVVDSTNNDAAWHNLSADVSNFIRGNWNSIRAA